MEELTIQAFINQAWVDAAIIAFPAIGLDFIPQKLANWGLQ
ncbi:hypothetical protein [Photobacterium halotolerans]|nr:hypothetical protein [Photobacterium halotolerans]